MKNLLLLLIFSTLGQHSFAKTHTIACQPTPNDTSEGGFTTFNSMPGTYDVLLKIGGRKFVDKLVITSVFQGASFASYIGRTEGTFSVPGVFESKLIKATFSDFRFDNQYYDFEFEIEANEGGRTYPVYFKFEGVQGQKQQEHMEPKYQSCYLSGKAYLKPVNVATEADVLGEAHIVKTSQPCVCL